jgi:hypothetical protein
MTNTAVGIPRIVPLLAGADGAGEALGAFVVVVAVAVVTGGRSPESDE